MNELHKRTRLDKSTINKLLKGVHEIIRDQIVNQNEVELESVGTLAPKKRLEYLYENCKTGERILFPPRISIRFIPNIELVHKINRLDVIEKHE